MLSAMLAAGLWYLELHLRHVCLCWDLKTDSKFNQLKDLISYRVESTNPIELVEEAVGDGMSFQTVRDLR